jgi:hypothetical protein
MNTNLGSKLGNGRSKMKNEHFEPQRTQRTQRENSVSTFECGHLTEGNSISLSFFAILAFYAVCKQPFSGSL